MAISASIFKAQIQVADLDRNYYADHQLTIARHPSETDARMMIRVLAFILNADEALSFGRGLSTDDEPALWHREQDGRIAAWIEVGLPDPKILKRAHGRAECVRVYAYGERRAQAWWELNQSALEKLAALEVLCVPDSITEALGALATRTMQLDATVQEGQLWLNAGETSLEIALTRWR